MKTKLLTVFILFVATFTNIFADSKEAATNALNFFVPFFPKEYSVRDLTNDYGFQLEDRFKAKMEYKNKMYHFYTAQSSAGDEFIVQTRFFSGYDYVIVAAGDKDIYDMDVKVYDENDNLVAIDRSTQKYSLPILNPKYIYEKNINNDYSILDQKISVRPTQTGDFTIKISIRNAAKDIGGNWALIIANKQAN